MRCHPPPVFTMCSKIRENHDGMSVYGLFGSGRANLKFLEGMQRACDDSKLHIQCNSGASSINSIQIQNVKLLPQ